jgi:Rps23 Pro-64 3,4-dihydroxylase Tpa1-like proline 4-hydroxylase
VNQHNEESFVDVKEAAEESFVGAEEEGGEDDLWSKRNHVLVSQQFLHEDLALELRGTFDSRFENPRAGTSERFVWDYWHVPKQYNLLRTPAKSYFSEGAYNDLEDALLTYGQQKLGCSSITPIWLSCYVDGCYQGLHADNPHGPWAFVLSLTDFEESKGGLNHKHFSGGETTILKPSVLEYWRTFDPTKGIEDGDIVDRIEPNFNQLTVFDPRLPHGVSKVHGTHDPLKGRLVLHGWFADPSPFYEGELGEDAIQSELGSCLEDIHEQFKNLPPAVGILSVRLHVTEDGEVESIDWLSDTLVPIPGAPVLALDGACVEPPEDARALILDMIVDHVAKLSFPKADGKTQITIPFVFE